MTRADGALVDPILTALVKLVGEITERQGVVTARVLAKEIRARENADLRVLRCLRSGKRLGRKLSTAIADGNVEVVPGRQRAFRRQTPSEDAVSPPVTTEAAETLTPMMQVVLDALMAAEAVHLGPVRVAEIASFLPEDACPRSASNRLRSIWISNVLRALCERGTVIPRKRGWCRLYARRGADGPIASAPTSGRSARQQVLSIAIAAWRQMKRPVRVSDVLNQGWPQGHPAGVERVVAHAMGSLAGTGQLVRVDRVLGGGVEGSTLYVPAGNSWENEKPRDPLSPLEVVALAFNAVWLQEVERASQERRRPRPISTGDIRRHLSANRRTGWPEVHTHDVGGLVGRLLVAANAPIRIAKAGSSSHYLLFVPAEVTDTEIDLEAAWVTATERIVEAARRAAARVQELVITQADVTEEIAADERLALVGRDAAHGLYYLSKDTIAWQNQVRRPRARQVVVCVGSVATVNQYVVRGRTETDAQWNDRNALARTSVALRQIVHETDAENLIEEIAHARTLPYIALKIGRLRTVAARAAMLQERVCALPTDRALAALANDANRRVLAIVRTAGQIVTTEHDANAVAACPEDIQCNEVGWTAKEFLAEWTRFDAAKARMAPSDVIRQLSLRVRRILNPDFVAHRYGGRIGAEWLFEKVNARLYLATRYGGRECSLLASMVAQALGRLRDNRYLLASATASSGAERLRGIAALSFVGGAEANEMLAALWEREGDPAVQAAILWGCAFNDQPQWHERAAEAARSAHPRLRRIGALLLRANSSAWGI